MLTCVSFNRRWLWWGTPTSGTPAPHPQARPAFLWPWHMWGTLRHHRFSQGRDVRLQGTTECKLSLCVHFTFTFSHLADAFIQSDLQLGRVHAVYFVFLIFTPSLLHRKSGSGECVMVNLSRAIPCPLDTTGRDCLPQSTQPTNALMESLFSSKVRPSSVLFHLALHLWF